AVWEKAGNTSKRTLAKIVKRSESCPEDRAPTRTLLKLIRDTCSRRHVAVSCFIKGSAARRQSHGGGIGQPNHSEGIVCRVLAPKRWIDVPPQPVSDCHSRCDFPGVLAVKREVLRQQGIALKCRGLSEQGRSREGPSWAS